MRIKQFIKKYSIPLIIINTFLVAFFSLGLGKIELEYSQKSWFREGDKLLANYQKFKDDYGPDSSMIMVVTFPEELSKKESIKRLKEFEEALWLIPNFTRIESILNFNKTTADEDEIIIQPIIPEDLIDLDESFIDQELKENKQLKNYLISKDIKTTALYGYLRYLRGEESKVAQGVAKAIKAQVLPKFPDLKVHLTGPAGMAAAFAEESMGDMKKLIPMALGCLFIILMLFLRNFFLVTISLGLILITVASTMGIQGWLGMKLGLVTGMCPLIVIAICIMDLVHILTGYLKNQGDIGASLEHNLKPTLLTSITTIIGFLSFTTAKLYPIADLGKIASIGIALAWIYTIFLICPMLYLIPIKKKFLAPYKASFPIIKPIYLLVKYKPLLIVLAFIGLTASNVNLTLSNPIDSNMQNYFAGETAFSKATKFFNKKIGATNTVEIILKSPTDMNEPSFLKKADAFIKDLEARADISKVVSLVHPLKEVHQMFNGGKADQYLVADSKEQIAQEFFFLDISLPPEKSIRYYHSVDKKEVRLSIFWHNSSSTQIKEASKEIVAMMKERNIDGYITGIAPLVTGVDRYIVQSFVESMLLATILISLFMMFVFKSVFIGFLSILPNIIVPSFGAAVLALLDKPFDTSSVLIFSICLGIAIDDTIYFITHYQERVREGNKTMESIKMVLKDAGSTLSLTTLILVSVFSLFIFGSFIPYKNFAIATSVILSFALVLDLLFLPALLVIVDKASIRSRSLFARG